MIIDNTKQWIEKRNALGLLSQDEALRIYNKVLPHCTVVITENWGWAVRWVARMSEDPNEVLPFYAFLDLLGARFGRVA